MVNEIKAIYQKNLNGLQKARIIICLIILLLFQISFTFIPSISLDRFYDPTMSTKFLLFLFIVQIVALLFFIKRLFIDRSFSLSIIDFLFGGVFLFIVLNRYFFQSEFGFSIRFYELLGLSVFYLVLRSTRNKNFYYTLLISVAVGANIQIIIGILQLYGVITSYNSYFKVTGSFFNSGPYAGYLAAVFPASLHIIRHKQNVDYFLQYTKKIPFLSEKLIMYLLLFNIIGCLCLIPALKSRACFLAVLSGVFLIYRKDVLLVLKRYLKAKATKYVLLFLLMLFIVGVSYLLLSFKKESSKGRFVVLKAAIEMVKTKPLIGFGYDRFRTNYMEFQAVYLTHSPDKNEGILADNTVYAFNEFLQFIIENGLTGFGLLVLFMYALFKSAKKGNELVDLAKNGLSSILVFSFFSYPSEILPIKLIGILYISIIGAFYSGDFIKEYNWVNKARNNFFSIFLKIGLLISFFFVCYHLLLQTLSWSNGYRVWGNAYAAYKAGNYNTARKGYEATFYLFNSDGNFLTEYGRTLYLSNDFKQGIEVLKKAKHYINNTVVENSLGDCYKGLKEYKCAEECYFKAIKMVPNSFYNRYLLFKLFEYSGETLKAINSAKELLKLTIKVPSGVTFQMINEVKYFLEEHSVPKDEK